MSTSYNASSEKNKRKVKKERIPPSIASLLDRSTIRISLILIPAFVVSFLISVVLNHLLTPILAEQTTREIARELGPDSASSYYMLKAIEEHNLSWCYITDAANTPLPATAAFTPRTRRIPRASQVVSIRDQNFYEAVVPLSGDTQLHAGFPYSTKLRMPNPTDPDSIASFFMAPTRLGSLLLVFCFVWLVMVCLIESILGRSLRLLGTCIDNLNAIVSEPYTEQQVKEFTRLSWTPSEIRALGQSLAYLMEKISIIKDEKREKGLEALKWKSQKRQFQPTEARQQAFITGDHASVESGVFALKFDKQLRQVESSYEFAVILLDCIHELYSDTFDAAAFMKIEKNLTVTIESVLGLDDESLEMLNRIDHREFVDERNMSKKSIDVGPMLIKKMGFDAFAAKEQISRIIYLPFYTEGKPLALLAGFMRLSKMPTPDRIKAAERFRDKALSLYFEHRMREEKEDDRWTDPATGLGNKTYFNELMPKVVERSLAKSDGRFSVLMLAPDFSTPRLARFPAELHDRWFTEIGRLISDLLPISRRIIPEKGATNYLIRFQEHVIAVVLEGINGNAAINVAEGIRSSVTSKSNWTGGASDLSVSVGVATFPRDGQSSEEIINRATITLSYIKEKLGGNAVCDAQKVPETYQPREATEIQGTLGVLDAAGLLQSIANSEKSGILIVENELGQKFVSTWLEGAPKQASLGDLAGPPAMVEFITTFKTGNYNFQIRTVTEAEATTQQGFRSLERCLMEAALLEDKMVSALKMIPSPDRYISSIDNQEGWSKAAEDEDVSPEETEAMKIIYSACDGSKTLSSIFKRLSNLPTALKWRAAALLIQYRLAELK